MTHTHTPNKGEVNNKTPPTAANAHEICGDGRCDESVWAVDEKPRDEQEHNSHAVTLAAVGAVHQQLWLQFGTVAV